MLDRFDFASWQKRIRLYCRGKENGGCGSDVQGRQNRGQGTNPQGGGAVGFGGVQNRVGNANPGQAKQVKCYNCNGIGHIAKNCTQHECPHNSDYYKDKMLLMQAQENGVALNKEQPLFLAGGQDNAIDEDVDEQPVQDLDLNVDNVFQADDCDAFNSNVDEAPTAQTMFMTNLSSADPVNDEAGPSYDLDILSVHDHDHYQDAVCEHHEEHVMHDNVQLNHVVDSHADYTSDSNTIPYVTDNAVPVVLSNVSSVPNDAYMMIYNDMYEPHAQSVSKTPRNIVVENSLTAELATYKEQVKLYERWARPKPYYNELNKVAIGYKNPLCLTRAKEVQHALYNGHKIIKDNHVSAIVHNTKDTLKIAEITMRKMNDKMKDPECVTHKVKIAPHDYSKENFLATFTPQKQLTPEQIFWSQDLIKIKSEALKEQTTVSRHKSIDGIITPTRLTEGEMGFEQTKECYLKEVIPFFKTIKEYFEGIQKALTKEIKEMKDVFEELKAEARCLELEAELSNLRDKSHKKNHDDVSKDHVKPKVLAPGKYAIDVEPIVPRLRNNREAHIDYLRHLKESVETIREIVEEAKVVRPLDSLIVFACRVNCCTDASRSQLRSNTKKNRISPAKGVNKMQVEEWLLKTYDEDSSRLMNFVKKFTRTVRFGNDHFGAIICYGDYVIGDSVISRVYYVEGLGHNLFSVRQFCDSDLEVAFRKHSCYVQDTDGVELIKGSHGSNLYTIWVKDMMKPSPICLLSKASKNKSWLWH
nr:integrase, catalytic region, zinc finger, CCHC-type, peptidase aspartic, catalytic [Tanacetum cinerariifolium]